MVQPDAPPNHSAHNGPFDSSDPEQIFLSDVHYGALAGIASESLLTDLLQLFRYCGSRRIRLSILGDLFDYWMEYPGQSPQFGTLIVEGLRQYHLESGIRPLLITGNHDNWTRVALENAGIDLEGESRIVRFGQRKGLLLHGDGLSDAGLRLPRPPLHRLLRHPLFVSLYQHLFPQTTGLRLMKWVSERSRNRDDSNPGRLNRWAEEYLGNSDTEFVICGHDHNPRMIRFKHGTLVNCGAFLYGRTVVQYTKGTFQLVRWEGRTNRFIPCNPDNPGSEKTEY
ncbi:MAG: UDP-2,3-diacylglucosamine diphosphatase [Balneolaceae bacterium]